MRTPCSWTTAPSTRTRPEEISASQARREPKPFLDWVRDDYDEAALKEIAPTIVALAALASMVIAVIALRRRGRLGTPYGRGVVAVLDSRMATARYGGFLRASLPPYWATTDATTVHDALRRLRNN